MSNSLLSRALSLATKFRTSSKGLNRYAVNLNRDFASKVEAEAPATAEPVQSSNVKKFYPRRCAMYVPGSDAKKMEKCLTIKSDSLVFDCEDGVAANQKVCELKHVHLSNYSI